MNDQMYHNELDNIQTLYVYCMRLVKGLVMATTVNISFQKNLLSDIDKQAKSERRSRSELVREAARSYIERKNRWQQMFTLGKTNAQQQGLTEKDIDVEIQAHRRAKRH
jgi:CopG family transcriptional regulator/antitoxin EndoAI